MRQSLIFVYTWVSALAASCVTAQGQFSRTIDAPPQAIGSYQRLRSNWQVNLYDGAEFGVGVQAGAPQLHDANIEVNVYGGKLGNGFEAYHGSRVNVLGGSGGRRLEAYDGSHINVTGGALGPSLMAFENSTIDISGGSIGNFLQVQSGSKLTLAGSEFRLNDMPIPDLVQNGDSVQLDISAGETLTGLLSDGTSFAFSPTLGDLIADGALNLVKTSVPEMGPPLIIASTDPVPPSIRRGQNLVVDRGGVVGDNFVAGFGSSFTVEEGGTVGEHLRAIGGRIFITGGTVGEDLIAMAGGRADISSGTLQRVSARAGGDIRISGGMLTSASATQGGQVEISGGEIERGIWVGPGSQMTISGGSVGEYSNVGYFGENAGTAQLTILGGTVGDDFQANSGSEVTIKGGAIGDGFDAWSDSEVTIHGSAFQLDGTPIEGLLRPGDSRQIDIANTAAFTGVYSDGTPFLFSGKDFLESDLDGAGDRFSPGTLTLVETTLPAIDLTPIVVNSDDAPLGVRAGQTLTVQTGGKLSDNFSAEASHVEIEPGAQVGRNFEARQSTVNIRGGIVEADFDAFAGTVVNISGGNIGPRLEAWPDSVINITGGNAEGIRAQAWSTINISGGATTGSLDLNSGSQATIQDAHAQGLQIGSSSRVEFGPGASTNYVSAYGTIEMTGGSVNTGFSINSNGRATISGGSIAPNFYARTGSRVLLIGNDFAIDGVPIPSGIPGSQTRLNVPRGATLSGILADGTPFAIDSDEPRTFYPEIIENGTLTLQFEELPDNDGPFLITASTDPIPLGMRNGQTLIVDNGGSVHDNFNAGPGSLTRIYEGGSVGLNFEASGARVVVTGGTVGPAFDAFAGSQLLLTAGLLGDVAEVYAGSQITITGGDVGKGFQAFSEGVVDIAGGTFDSRFRAHPGSQVNLYGSEFRLAGADFGELPLGIPQLVRDRQTRLQGTLADGHSIRFELFRQDDYPNDYFSNLATVTVTRVSLLEGDYNSNGIVDQGDLDLVLLHWGEELFSPFADGWINDLPTGTIDQEELDRVLTSWGTSIEALGAASVPEPATGFLLLTLAAVTWFGLRHGSRSRAGFHFEAT